MKARPDQILPSEDEVHWLLLCIVVCWAAGLMSKNVVGIVKVEGYISPAGTQESFYEVDAKSASKPFLYEAVPRPNNCSNGQRV